MRALMWKWRQVGHVASGASEEWEHVGKEEEGWEVVVEWVARIQVGQDGCGLEVCREH